MKNCKVKKNIFSIKLILFRKYLPLHTSKTKNYGAPRLLIESTHRHYACQRALIKSQSQI